MYKDEVREIGRLLDIPENIINRHPFPGPGLSIRIIGDITKDRIKILQEADYIFISKLKEYNLYSKVWQAGVILLPIQWISMKYNMVDIHSAQPGLVVQDLITTL
mgnify:CR=1 FL=1